MRITRYACVLHGMAWVRLDKDAPFGVSWVAATDGEWVRYEEAMRAATAALAADVAKAGLARVAELEAHLENAREDWRTAYARLEKEDARVAELETDPRMALTADDLRWAAHEANQTAKWLCAYPARHADDATTALARAERFGTANRAALAAEKGDEV